MSEPQVGEVWLCTPARQVDATNPDYAIVQVIDIEKEMEGRTIKIEEGRIPVKVLRSVSDPKREGDYGWLPLSVFRTLVPSPD